MVQIIPSELFVQPPEIKVIKDVRGPDTVKPVKSVVKGSSQPQTAEHPKYVPVVDENRHDVQMQQEQRTYCRRIYHWPVLEELRSLIDRRQHGHGEIYLTKHIDEEV